jgi:hypothetical protein
LKLLEILWLIYGSATLGKALEGVVHKGVSLVVITSYVVYGIIALAVFVGFILFVVAICKYADRANAEPE